MAVVTFHNVTIAIEAKDVREAYRDLNGMMVFNEDIIDAWSTDTYTVDDFNGKHHSTSELFDWYEQEVME